MNRFIHTSLWKFGPILPVYCTKIFKLSVFFEIGGGFDTHSRLNCPLSWAVSRISFRKKDDWQVNNSIRERRGKKKEEKERKKKEEEKRKKRKNKDRFSFSKKSEFCARKFALKYLEFDRTCIAFIAKLAFLAIRLHVDRITIESVCFKQKARP